MVTYTHAYIHLINSYLRIGVFESGSVSLEVGMWSIFPSAIGIGMGKPGALVG